MTDSTNGGNFPFAYDDDDDEDELDDYLDSDLEYDE